MTRHACVGPQLSCLSAVKGRGSLDGSQSPVSQFVTVIGCVAGARRRRDWKRIGEYEVIASDDTDTYMNTPVESLCVYTSGIVSYLESMRIVRTIEQVLRKVSFLRSRAGPWSVADGEIKNPKTAKHRSHQLRLFRTYT